MNGIQLAAPPEAVVAVSDPERGTWADRALRYTLVATILAGFATPTSLNRSPTPTVFLVLVCGIAVVGFFGPARAVVTSTATWGLVAVGYSAIKTTAWAFGGTGAGLLDFEQAYKAFFFLIPIAWFIGRRCFTVPALAKTVRWMLGLILLKYVAMLGLGVYRPSAWTENNFELMTVIGLTYLAWPDLGRRRNLWMGALCAIVAISQSRCSILELGVVLLALYWQPRSKVFLFNATALGVGAWYATRVIERRTRDGIEGTDRYHFWRVFLEETHRWGAPEWLIGTPPLTPMSGTSCSRLDSYGGLFALSGDPDRCYSVILHMFALRSIVDNGIVGTALLLVLLYAALKRSGATMRDRVAVLGVGIANSLSVSGFNSEYMLIPLVVAVGLTRQERIRALACTSDDVDGDVGDRDRRGCR